MANIYPHVCYSAFNKGAALKAQKQASNIYFLIEDIPLC